MEAGDSFELQELICQLTRHYTPGALNCHQHPRRTLISCNLPPGKLDITTKKVLPRPGKIKFKRLQGKLTVKKHNAARTVGFHENLKLQILKFSPVYLWPVTRTS